MLTLTLQTVNPIGDAETLSVTEHATLTESLNEFEGWRKSGANAYMVQGNMTVACACKRVLESRNRAISLYVTLAFNETDAAGSYIEVKAPQAVKYLETVLGGAENAEVTVTITNTEFRIG